GDEANVYSHGYMCNKAASIPKYVDHDQRATRPLRRRPDGTFEAIDWDTAISEIGARLKKIREEHSPKSVALVGIGGQANHMDILYGLSFLELVGTPKWYNAYAQEKTQHHLVDQLLFDAPPGVRLHGEIEESDCVVYIGTNPRISNRVERSNNVVAAIGKDPSKYVITVDPRQTETTKTADLHVRVRPGTDAYLLLAVLKTIMEDDDLVDSDFLAEHATGAEELRAALGQVDVDEMSARCGVPRDTIELFARKFAEAERASILYDLGIEQIPFLTLVSYVIHLLPVVTGNLGKRGGMLFMGGAIPPERVVDRFEREPERALASGTQAIYALTNIRPMFSPSLVPEEILVDHPERIRALFVEGSNPYLSFSDTAKWQEARQKLDLMVVIDPAMTETARDADYVLPVPSGYEKWEISSFPKGFPEVYMLVRRPVVSRRGDT
ncbi:MAG: molybdopterin oxidoreductase family protein, partial [Deltaproteobacteria bacterium]